MVGPVAQPAVVSEPPSFQRHARLALVLVLVGLGAWTLHGFIDALVWAAIIAVAIGPLYARAARRWPAGRHNILLPLIVATLTGVMFLLPFVLLGIQAARDAHDVLGFVSGAMQNGIPVPELVSKLPLGSTIAAWWTANLAAPTGLADLTHKVTHGLFEIRSREFGLALTHRVVTFFFTIVALFFILRDEKALARDMLRASHRMFGPHGERIARQIVSSIHGTVDGLVLVGLGEGVLLGIAFALAGVPHATLLGALSAVAAMIPFVIVVMLVVVGLVLLAQGAVATAVAVVVFGIVMNSIADHFVRPGLIGGATQLPFLWVLLGILGGVETWGLIGLFIGPALMSALILLWREWVRPGPLPETRPAPANAAALAPVPVAGE